MPYALAQIIELPSETDNGVANCNAAPKTANLNKAPGFSSSSHYINSDGNSVYVSSFINNSGDASSITITLS